MKTITASAKIIPLDSAMIRPQQPSLVFGAGYLQYLSTTAIYDDELTTRPMLSQPVRYLGAVEPMMDEVTSGWARVGKGVHETLGEDLGRALAIASKPAPNTPSLREAVIALREAIRAS